MTESVPTGGVGLWYTGCYINEEDACLLDQMNNKSDSSYDSDTFPDSKAITVKNITVSLILIIHVKVYQIIPES